jgi:hypothetical protein
MKISALQKLIVKYDEDKSFFSRANQMVTNLRAHVASLLPAGAQDRDLTNIELLTLFNTFIVTTVPRNFAPYEIAKANGTLVERLTPEHALFSGIIEELIKENTPVLKSGDFWYAMDEMHAMGLATQANYELLIAQPLHCEYNWIWLLKNYHILPQCLAAATKLTHAAFRTLRVLSAADILTEANFNELSKIDATILNYNNINSRLNGFYFYDLLRDMLEFNILNQATFDLIVKYREYASDVANSMVYRGLTAEGLKLSLHSHSRVEVDNAHIYKDIAGKFILATHGKYRNIIEITEYINEPLAASLRENSQKEKLPLADYNELKGIAARFGFYLRNNLTPEIFNLFFVDMFTVIKDAVEDFLIAQYHKNPKNCLEIINRNKFSEIVSNNPAVQKKIVDALEFKPKALLTPGRMPYQSSVMHMIPENIIMYAVVKFDYSGITLADISKKASERPAPSILGRLFSPKPAASSSSSSSSSIGMRPG